MKLTEIFDKGTPHLSFEVFPPKTTTAFENVKAATEEIATLSPSFMSVTYGAGGGTSQYTLDIAKNIMGVDVELAPGETVPYLHPVNSFRIKSRTADYGYMGIIHPEVKKATDKRFNVAVLEIDFEKLANTVAYARKIKSVSKYQAVEIDYNVVCDKTLIYAELQKKLSKQI